MNTSNSSWLIRNATPSPLHTPAEELNIELTNLNKLLAAGAIDWDTYGRAVFDAQDKFEAAVKKTNEATNAVTEFQMKALENIQDALGQNLYDIATGNFDNIGKAFTQMLTRMAAEAVAADLMNSLFGKKGADGTRSGVADWLKTAMNFATSFFVPGRANGGGVMAGGLYQVNERSPELLSMGGKQYLMMGNQGGTVMPNRGNGSTNVTNHFSVQGRVDRRTEAQIGRAATRGVQRAQRWL